uniref:Uncharacterized protein n=1 Tax=Rangifer tarandus platyrhynchus TaxID=3082113 RepID=A0ACB0E8T1_RANTA|nr:unnamed protein product [Rangifer tarandus platyrhynchus]
MWADSLFEFTSPKLSPSSLPTRGYILTTNIPPPTPTEAPKPGGFVYGPAPTVRSRDPGRAERKRGAEKVDLPRARSARAGYAAKTPSSSHGRARRPEGDEASTAEAAGVGAREGWVSG